MRVSLDVELSGAELDALRGADRSRFLSAEEVHDALLALIRAELGPPSIELGELHSVVYVRPDHEGPDVGFRHVFKKRPRLVWDGRQLATRDGSFRVTDSTGIVDTFNPQGSRAHG